MLLLMLVINSVVWAKVEKPINICISQVFQELELRCINQQFVLRLAQQPPLKRSVQNALQFRHQLMLQQSIAQHQLTLLINFSAFVLQRLLHLLIQEMLRKLLLPLSCKKLKMRPEDLEPLSNF
jgi:hypothetical protein